MSKGKSIQQSKPGKAEKPSVSPRYYELMERLQETDFALVELTLYLDTHPHDLKALEQFNQLSQVRQRQAAQFEQEFGPLLGFGHNYSRYPWQWKEAPWPWQV